MLKIAGVDEVGRGPLAGPVIAAVVVLPEGSRARLDEAELRDSKMMSKSGREKSDALIREHAHFAYGGASAIEIDAFNIRRATHLAMRRAIMRLAITPDAIEIDGRDTLEGLAAPTRAIIGGDKHCAHISAASIIAKTLRDRLMERLAARYPGYGWERNAGYGTREHIEAIRTLGPTPHHRMSFRPLCG